MNWLIDKNSNQEFEASRILESLLHRSKQMKQTLPIDRCNGELFEQMDCDLRVIKTTIHHKFRRSYSTKNPSAIWELMDSFFVAVINLLSKLLSK